MRDESTVIDKPEVGRLFPPGDAQVVSAERIRFSVLDLRIVIRAELQKVDQVHRLDGSPTSLTPADPAGLG